MDHSGRETFTVVELDQDYCALTYGVAPCMAELGVTGPRKCFNTRATCQDLENYDRIVKTVRFCTQQQYLPEYPVIPILVSTSTAPTEINPGGGGKNSGPLGKRARVSIVFDDAPHSDIGLDPYISERGYNAMDRGTFWTKWLARNPYYNGRMIRVKEGYAGQELADMVTRTYVIDKIDGPDNKGRVKVTALDILALTTDEKAQVPRASVGALLSDIADIADGVVDPVVLPFIEIVGAPTTDYPAPGTVRINDEIMTYTGVAVAGANIRLTSVTRRTDGSEANSHNDGDRVQLCLRYVDTRVDYLAKEWLTVYGNVPEEYIDWVAWQAEADVWLDQFSMTGLITESSGVQGLLSEITEQALFYIWWDERSQLIKLQAIKPAQTPVALLTGVDNILKDSAELSQDPASRISQLWMYWGQRNAAESLSKDSNYRHVTIRTDAEAETAEEYGEQKIKKVFSRWLTTDAQVINTSTRLLSRYRDNPKYLEIDLDAKDREYWTGSVVDVEHRSVVDDTGLPQRVRWQVISAQEKIPGHSISLKLFAYEFVVTFRGAYWMVDDAPDFEDATEEEIAHGAWWSDIDGKMPDGSDGFLWI